MSRLARLALVALLLGPVSGRAGEAGLSPASNYLLGCAGCHGETGVSNAQLVPELQGKVGFFLNTAEGRSYLVRLPNIAFSTLSDAELAEMLNYMVVTIGGASRPAGAKPYTAAEVTRWRKQPLTEVSLSHYRAELIDQLIAHYGAPDSMRVYGSDYVDVH